MEVRHRLRAVPIALEEARESCQQVVALRRIANDALLGEEIFGCDGSRQNQIVIKLDKSVAQPRYAPRHRLDGYRVEGRQILLVSSKDCFVVDYLNRNITFGEVLLQKWFEVRVLLVSYEVDFVNPRCETVYGCHAVEDFAQIVESGVACHVLFGDHFGCGEGLSFGFMARIIAIDPRDYGIYLLCHISYFDFLGKRSSNAANSVERSSL